MQYGRQQGQSTSESALCPLRLDLRRGEDMTEFDVFSFLSLISQQAFMMQGDVMHPSMSLLPDLLESGIRVLIYAGEDDFMSVFLFSPSSSPSPSPFLFLLANSPVSLSFTGATTSATTNGLPPSSLSFTTTSTPPLSFLTRRSPTARRRSEASNLRVRTASLLATLRMSALRRLATWFHSTSLGLR
jgi:hypothetical protein